MGTTDIVDYGVLCKNITKPTESSLQNKEYSVVVLEEPRKQTIEKKKNHTQHFASNFLKKLDTQTLKTNIMR